MKERPDAFLSLVRLLEERVGDLRTYSPLEPFRYSAVQDGKPSIIAIQNAAKIVAEHVGLAHLVFVVSFTTHAANTAGHIELDHASRDVFVELSYDICNHPNAVLATLCHEISHKFLHIHGIRAGHTTIEQEYLTDVTAVFLGMGKIMLNGCVSVTTQTNGRQTKTNTLKVGYISRECFAFVYNLLCVSRQIPKADRYLGISESALSVLRACETEFQRWFEPDLVAGHDIDAFAKDLMSGLHVVQDSTARKEWLLRQLRLKFDSMDLVLRNAHGSVHNGQDQIAAFSRKKVSRSLRHLLALELRVNVGESVKSAEELLRAHAEDWRDLDSFAEALVINEVTQEAVVICCPLDGVRLRVPNGRKRLIVTCPSCRYQFVVNTAIPVPQENAAKDSRAGRIQRAIFRLTRQK